jgi:hypothetical protein
MNLCGDINGRRLSINSNNNNHNNVHNNNLNNLHINFENNHNSNSNLGIDNNNNNNNSSNHKEEENIIKIDLDNDKKNIFKYEFCDEHIKLRKKEFLLLIRQMMSYIDAGFKKSNESISIVELINSNTLFKEKFEQLKCLLDLINKLEYMNNKIKNNYDVKIVVCSSTADFENYVKEGNYRKKLLGDYQALVRKYEKAESDLYDSLRSFNLEKHN